MIAALSSLSLVSRAVTYPMYDQKYWEERWAEVLREHPDQVARRPPNAHLIGEVENLRPGIALDAGCGHGADTLWLAARGWRVTAVDFSAAALTHARSRAEAVGPDVGGRIDWVKAIWRPGPLSRAVTTSWSARMFTRRDR